NDPQSEADFIQDNSNDFVVTNERGKVIRGGLAKSAYAVMGTKWDKSHLTYRLDGNWTSRDEAITAEAFNAVGSVIPMTFQLVDASTTPDIYIYHVTPGSIGGQYGTANVSAGGAGGPMSHYRCRIQMGTLNEAGYSPNQVANRYNLFMHVMMHEIVHCMGVDHSQFQNNLMSPHVLWGQSPPTYESYPLLHFLSPDDIQALQSIYGSVPPKYPIWDHRYNLGYLHYISFVPAQG